MGQGRSTLPRQPHIAAKQTHRPATGKTHREKTTPGAEGIWDEARGLEQAMHEVSLSRIGELHTHRQGECRDAGRGQMHTSLARSSESSGVMGHLGRRVRPVAVLSVAGLELRPGRIKGATPLLMHRQKTPSHSTIGTLPVCIITICMYTPSEMISLLGHAQPTLPLHLRCEKQSPKHLQQDSRNSIEGSACIRGLLSWPQQP